MPFEFFIVQFNPKNWAKSNENLWIKNLIHNIDQSSNTTKFCDPGSDADKISCAY